MRFPKLHCRLLERKARKDSRFATIPAACPLSRCLPWLEKCVPSPRYPLSSFFIAPATNGISLPLIQHQEGIRKFATLAIISQLLPDQKSWAWDIVHPCHFLRLGLHCAGRKSRLPRGITKHKHSKVGNDKNIDDGTISINSFHMNSSGCRCTCPVLLSNPSITLPRRPQLSEALVTENGPLPCILGTRQLQAKSKPLSFCSYVKSRIAISRSVCLVSGC
ncbi:hypothetical protein F5Y18DRAFT_29049 [Xylariaceae sp. FL1019]|nr:hypothetical protein F5Y18DRAFT_29049 [Xylariaceae sp. FL1019]